jgi:parvulin-like peptidyl-prolyl isomerase
MKFKKPAYKPFVTRQLKKVRRVAKGKEEPTAAGALPHITNETVAAHREEVLASARKYIYPLQHSKRRVVQLSLSILIVAVFGFLIWCGLALYSFQSTSAFTYDITKVIPFPIAKVGSDYIYYENYLFELRHTMHYYETQQQANFSTSNGKLQLNIYKKEALQDVINNTYVKQLAGQNHISVSNQDVDNEVALVRSENRLGGSQQVFQDVLNEFWGWSVSDFRRELKQQLLAQKVVSTLDTGTWQRARQALWELDHGTSFATVAFQTSDDSSTRAQGGQYNGTITESDTDIAPQVTAELFKLKPGQVSGIINTGYSLEIVQLTSQQGDSVKAAHIEFNFKDISTYIKPLEAKEPSHQYINI